MRRPLCVCFETCCKTHCRGDKHGPWTTVRTFWFLNTQATKHVCQIPAYAPKVANGHFLTWETVVVFPKFAAWSEFMRNGKVAKDLSTALCHGESTSLACQLHSVWEIHLLTTHCQLIQHLYKKLFLCNELADSHDHEIYTELIAVLSPKLL